ncbi:MAG: type IV pilus biogenesis/stability protein PilW, partial [Gammaproteobacteria bacterium]|nr:type IV pilus biogenesis/stability protein PilW [Gammaproteobacteria bacterium]
MQHAARAGVDLFRQAARSWLVGLTWLLTLSLSGCATLDQDSPVAASSTGSTSKLAEVQTELGIGYLSRGQLDLAWKRLSRALELDPHYATAHFVMGLLQERLEQPEKAEASYRRAVELDPLNSAAQTNLGSFLCRTDRFDEGEWHNLLALKNSLYEKPEIAYTNAGLCAERAGRGDKAEEYFKAALQRNGQIPAALIGMTQASYDDGRYLNARAFLERYLATGREDPRALLLGMRIEKALGDNAASADYARRLKTQFPTSPEAEAAIDADAS